MSVEYCPAVPNATSPLWFTNLISFPSPPGLEPVTGTSNSTLELLITSATLVPIGILGPIA